MRFSSRTPVDFDPNDVSAAADAARDAGTELIDLTITNPTIVGLPDQSARIAHALASAAGAPYEPDPRGLRVAREAVAAHHAARGLAIDPDDVLITCSSSESYSYLFKLLCDAGDEVMIPSPSYPLFAHLAALEAVTTAPYGDPRRVRTSDRTRAVIAVSPNNPTGEVLDAGAVDVLDQICAQAGCALVGDEVFADYAAPHMASVLGARHALAFSLGGLSKACGLPQLKLGWIVMAGPRALVEAARPRLELIADTYLSVASPVQHALPALMQIGKDIRASIRARIAQNRAALAPILPSDGGWTAIVSVSDEDSAVAQLLADGVIVQPGWFYDLPGDHLVLSLLTPPDDVARALPALARVR
ncbi:MAG TPA: pyridoxal phosphate-dependent aminotransferase [Kofleriaceae bacterium]|nr:pyridoxal phosphate-dependent aminotransferase [Kofleriaceae bacterium]